MSLRDIANLKGKHQSRKKIDGIQELKKESMTILGIQISVSKRKKFKRKCLDLDISMSDVVNSAIDDFLNN